MKKSISIILAILLVMTFGFFAMGSGESETTDQGTDTASKAEENPNKLGNYSVVIDSCRLTKNYEGKDTIVVKYIFTNDSAESSASFMWTIIDEVYQDGVSLEKTFSLEDGDSYDESAAEKEIKAGVSLEVEVPYILNNAESDVEVEVSESISFEDKTITKTFSIK